MVRKSSSLCFGSRMCTRTAPFTPRGTLTYTHDLAGNLTGIVTDPREYVSAPITTGTAGVA